MCSPPNTEPLGFVQCFVVFNSIPTIVTLMPNCQSSPYENVMIVHDLIHMKGHSTTQATSDQMIASLAWLRTNEYISQITLTAQLRTTSSQGDIDTRYPRAESKARTTRLKRYQVSATESRPRHYPVRIPGFFRCGQTMCNQSPARPPVTPTVAMRDH